MPTRTSLHHVEEWSSVPDPDNILALRPSDFGTLSFKIVKTLDGLPQNSFRRVGNSLIVPCTLLMNSRIRSSQGRRWRSFRRHKSSIHVSREALSLDVVE